MGEVVYKDPTPKTTENFNQLTGNCFRMVRIVLKITFLKLRYPKDATGRLPVCPIMALDLPKQYPV